MKIIGDPDLALEDWCFTETKTRTTERIVTFSNATATLATGAIIVRV
jgi:hypothetical protein